MYKHGQSEYGAGIVLFDEREADKRERFVQTYVILFGLLLSYNQVTWLQSTAMAYFLIFLFFIMTYYSFLNTNFWIHILSKTYGVKMVVFFVNLTAFVSTFALSSVIMLFFVRVGDGISSISLSSIEFNFSVLGISIFLYIPLFIKSDMFK